MMKNTIELRDSLIDFENVTISDFEKNINIIVYSEIQELLNSNEDKEVMDKTIFGVDIKFGEKQEKTIMVDAPINDLELFAKSILAHIDIVRKNYGEQIKIQTNWGAII
jgi:hypothetical protein